MLVLKPDYYDRFKCIKDKCPFTCCAGWFVTIDDDTYDRYDKLNTKYGDLIKSTIENTKDFGYVFKMDERGRCTHLSEKGLCNIYSNVSEDYMCVTCKVYPRSSMKYANGIYELDLVASCPEVARHLVERKDSIAYDMKEYEVPDIERKYLQKTKEDYDESYYNFIVQSRSDIIDIFQNRKYSIYEKCMMLSTFSESIQNIIFEYNNWSDKIIAVKEAIKSDEYMKMVKASKAYQIVNKVKFLKRLLETEIDLKHCDKSFIDSILAYITRLTTKLTTRNIEDIYKDEMEFFKYFEANYSNVYENYTVYLSFRGIRNVLNHNNINVEAMFIIMSVVIIQVKLYSKWISNEKTIDDKDIEEAIYKYSRFMEHNRKKLYDLLSRLTKEKLSLYDLAKMII